MNINNSRKKIILASVLKPVDDVRMFNKIGKSLSQQYDVHIIGFQGALKESKEQNIIFHPLYSFNRKNKSRVFASLIFLKKIKEISADLIIVHAIELLPIILIYKIFNPKIRLIYDIRENYFANVKNQNIYPWYLKIFILPTIKLLEYCSQLFVSHYILAEKSYSKELGFIKGKYSIIENKCIIDFKRQNERIRNDKLTFVFPGTISKVYGAKEAINLTKKIIEKGVEAELIFVGKIIENELQNDIKLACKEYPDHFHLIGGQNLVSHEIIISNMLKADFVLLSYQNNNSINNCIPTRLYECLAYKIPMLIQQNKVWEEICNKYKAAIFTDFKNPNIDQLLPLLENKKFYQGINIIEEALWNNERKKISGLISEILNSK